MAIWSYQRTGRPPMRETSCRAETAGVNAGRQSRGSDVARGNHADQRDGEENRGDALAQGDPPGRFGLRPCALAQPPAGAADQRALRARRDDGAKRAESQDAFDRAEAAFMQQTPQISAGQHGDDCGAHLRPEQRLGAELRIAGERESRAGPEDRGESVKGKRNDHDGRHRLTPIDERKGYTTPMRKRPGRIRAIVAAGAPPLSRRERPGARGAAQGKNPYIYRTEAPVSPYPSPMPLCERRSQRCDRVPCALRERRRRRVEREPTDRGDLVGLAIDRFALGDRCAVDRRDPMLAVDSDHLGHAKQRPELETDADLLLSLARNRRFDAFEEVDLAARQAPMGGLGNLAALDQQDAAVAKDRRAAADARFLCQCRPLTPRSPPRCAPRSARLYERTSARISRSANAPCRRRARSRPAAHPCSIRA